MLALFKQSCPYCLVNKCDNVAGTVDAIMMAVLMLSGCHC